MHSKEKVQAERRLESILSLYIKLILSTEAVYNNNKNHKQQ